MPVVVQSTVDLLETELAKARTTLEEIQPNAAPVMALGDDITAGAMAAYKKNLIGYNHDFFHGHRRLTPKELGFVTVQEVISTNDDGPFSPQEEQIVLSAKRPSLVDVLSNNIILDHMAPLLPISSLMSLAATSRTMRSIILETPYVFRRLDLTTCRGAMVPQIAPIDAGGEIWRNERMDESLTEDDFYAGPLRGIFSQLERRSILESVRTLVLDGLSVPADLVADIILTDRFNVNILSIRECLHMNERKLMQVLQYAVRPGRPKGTPKVKGIYHFTPKKPIHNTPRSRRPASRREWWKSQLGSSQDASYSKTTANQDSESASTALSRDMDPNARLDHLNEWYRPSGRILRDNIEDGWAQTIQKCEGIIAFDAVLCRGPRHNVDLYSASNKSQPRPEAGLLGPAIATIALGPHGCDGCHTSPEGPAIWGKSPDEHFPLLCPPPLYSSKVVDAKRPVSNGENGVFIARCAECLKNRWCHRCNKWFCFNCLPHPEEVMAHLSPHQTAVRAIPGSRSRGQSPERKKLGPGVSRDCWECGPTCASCKLECQRSCESCPGEYCIEHNDGCSTTRCDWCNTSSRRLGRDLY
ncbi:hypothetical protein VTN77DRAFT_8514 [Rasamsonia byssochlamydoides]|uniref:uncharacterized protein n=1 Tax=Rasamsonia byssochlamydoides TaxID=89139 RepID=UPI00374490A6